MSGDAHHPLAPSSAARWSRCPGSVRMAKMFPERHSTDAADEGTMAHTFAAAWLRGERILADTAEMREGVERYTSSVQSVTPSPVVEAAVPMPGIYQGMWGTADAYYLDHANRTAFLWDLKYGFGLVECFENWQLVCYAAGLMDMIGEGGHLWSFKLHIVQPRAYHREGPVRMWFTTGARIAALARDLRVAAEEAMGPDPQLHAGSWCKHCPARHDCPALQAAAADAMDEAYSAQVLNMPAAVAGRELRWLRAAQERMAARITGIEAVIEADIRAGKVVPGWTLQSGLGREKWTRPDREVLALGDLMGISLATAITPAQARKAGVDAAVLASYATRGPSEAKLVEVSTTQARKAFAGAAG